MRAGDAAITDQAFQRHAGHLAAGLVKGGQVEASGVSSMIIHTGSRFQCTDVAALAADDAALHFVAGQRHHTDGGLAAVVGSSG